MEQSSEMEFVSDLTLMPAIVEFAVGIWICGTEPRLKVRVRVGFGLPRMLS